MNSAPAVPQAMHMRPDIPPNRSPREALLVTVGIPTYNRSASLRRALDSVFAQTYRSIEILVSDNCSTDATEAVCKEYAARSPALRYIRQPVNIGPTANFNCVRSEARGSFFMWLADDDWIDPAYVERCVEQLLLHPDAALVAGIAHMESATNETQEGVAMNLEQSDPRARVLKYFWNVRDNSAFYGLMRNIPGNMCLLRNAMGGDWLLVAALAFTGQVRTLPAVVLHRTRGGTSATGMKIARTLGLSKWSGMFPYVTAGIQALIDIGWRSEHYQPLGAFSRLALGLRCAFAIIARKAAIEPGLGTLSWSSRTLLGDTRHQRIKAKVGSVFGTQRRM